MRYQFLRLSTLKNRAEIEVAKHVAAWNKKKQVFNNMVGTAATNKDWLASATRKYELARKKTSYEKIDALIAGLFDVYKCVYRMEYSRFNDNNVTHLREKLETTYIHTAIEFIESVIHEEKHIEQNLPIIKQAINLLAENDSKLARGYASMLEQYKQIQDSIIRLEELLHCPALEFTQKDAAALRSLMNFYQERFRKDKCFHESILLHIRNKMEELYLLYSERYEQASAGEEPSIEKLASIVDDFEAIHRNLTNFAHSVRYLKFIGHKEKLNKLRAFIKEDYQSLKSLYGYLSFPREEYDIRKLSNAYSKIGSYHQIIQQPYRELTQLEPGLGQISERIEAVLSEHYNKDLLEYHKVFNNIINLTDEKEKLRENIKFFKTLNSVISDHKKSRFVLTKLNGIR